MSRYERKKIPLIHKTRHIFFFLLKAINKIIKKACGGMEVNRFLWFYKLQILNFLDVIRLRFCEIEVYRNWKIFTEKTDLL